MRLTYTIKLKQDSIPIIKATPVKLIVKKTKALNNALGGWTPKLPRDEMQAIKDI